MILDTNLLMCNKLNAFAAAGTALVGDVIPLGAITTNKNPIRGTWPLYLVLTVTTAFVGATATIDIQLATGTVAAIPTNGTATGIWRTQPQAVATMTLNRRWIATLPWDPDPDAFMGILVTTAVATTTAGAITAEITAFAPQDYVAPFDAVN